MPRPNAPRRAALRAAALLAGVVALASTPVSPAAAQAIDSAYSSLAVDDCTPIEQDRMGGRWACPGFGGWTAIVSEYDLRQTLLLRRDGRTLGPAPRVLPFNAAGDTLEWRLARRDGRWRPFALIVRFFIADLAGGPDIQRLYVLRLDPAAGVLCSVGAVPVAGNPDANREARALADGLSGTPAGTGCDGDDAARGKPR